MRRTLEKKLEALLENIAPGSEEVLEYIVEQWQKLGKLEFYHRESKEYRQMQEILELNKALNQERNTEALLILILDHAIHFSNAERGFIILADQGKVAVARNFDQEAIQDAEFKISHSLAQTVMQTGKTLVTADAQNDPGLPSSGSVRKLGLRSVLCLPLCIQNQTLGVLYLDNRFCADAFADSQLRILEAFADQAALALHTSKLLTSLEQAMSSLSQLQQKWENEAMMEEKPSKPTAVVESQRSLAVSSRSSTTNTNSSKENTTANADICRMGQLVCASPKMKLVLQIAQRAATSNVPILITGPSGSGKGILAQAIHENSQLSQGPMITENCAAIPENLLESELFGYMRGAFTGAQENRLGLFDMAEGGTLFLDEIAEMSLPMQAKLLRVLEHNLIRPLGSTKEHTVHFRLISATHRDLPQRIANQEFREDLWYRLKVVTIELPPLCERPDDIPILVNHFLHHLPEAKQKKIQSIEPNALEILLCYSWPGNVRQLEHELRRIIALQPVGKKISSDDIAPEIRGTTRYAPITGRLTLKDAVQRFEHNYILETIQSMNGNRTKAAQVLGLSRRTLYNKFLGMEETV